MQVNCPAIQKGIGFTRETVSVFIAEKGHNFVYLAE